MSIRILLRVKLLAKKRFLVRLQLPSFFFFLCSFHLIVFLSDLRCIVLSFLFSHRLLFSFLVFCLAHKLVYVFLHARRQQTSLSVSCCIQYRIVGIINPIPPNFVGKENNNRSLSLRL